MTTPRPVTANDAPPDLAGLVREFLIAEADATSSPCLHRYRGAVRVREIARRRARRDKAIAELMAAVGFNPWSKAQ